MQQYRAISFDVGYTLVEPREEAQLVVQRFVATLGIAPTHEQLIAAYERAEKLYRHNYNQPLNDTWASDARIREFFEGYYVQLLGDLGIPDTERSHARTIIEHYLEPSNWRVYPGVYETLQELRRRGFRIGIASDWGTDLRRLLVELDFLPLLDWAVISGGVGHAKPSPAFYNMVVRRSGMPADLVLHVGDNYRADVLGARTAGMDAVLIDWSCRPLPRLDVPVLSSLTELLDLLPQ